MTITAASTSPINGYAVRGLAALLPGLGLFGTVFTNRKRKPLTRKGSSSMRVFGLLLVFSLFSLWAVGCGGYSSTAQTSQSSTPSTSQVTVTVTGTSGAITQSTPVTITIN
jgi:hypothetical protein